MAVLVVSLILFYCTHSLLASPAVKNWAAARMGLVKWYRLFYTLISLLLLAPVIWALLAIPAPVLIYFSLPLQLGAMVLMLLGIGLSLLSVMRFGAMGFLGLLPEKKGALVKTGIHGRIRHPIYTGIIVASIGWVILSPTLPVLITIIITFIYLPIGIHLEERKLISQFGEEYIRYRFEVPALIPRPRWSAR